MPRPPGVHLWNEGVDNVGGAFDFQGARPVGCICLHGHVGPAVRRVSNKHTHIAVDMWMCELSACFILEHDRALPPHHPSSPFPYTFNTAKQRLSGEAQGPSCKQYSDSFQPAS